jgi:hypothetical protein
MESLKRLTLRGVRVSVETRTKSLTPNALKIYMEMKNLLESYGAVLVTTDPSIIVHKRKGKVTKDENDGILHVTDHWLDLLRVHPGGMLPSVENYVACEYDDVAIARFNDALRHIYAYALEEQLL